MKINRVLLAVAASGLALVMADIAAAQVTAPTTDTPVQDDDGPEGEADQEIVVTGSRIKRPNTDTLEPSISVNSEYLENRGITNIAQALNELPAVRNSVTPNGDQSGFGVGLNFSNVFGLGSNRTLTLINGRRVVSSNTPTIFGPAAAGLQVDLNIVPAQLVERIDQLSVGGAPTYGSDAIAGVINVILKNRFRGFEIGATTGITERGDNARYNVNATGGFDFGDGRGNLTLSGSYDKADGVLSNARRRNQGQFFNGVNPSAAQAAVLGPAGRSPANDGRVDPNIPFNAGATDGVPSAVFYRDRRIFVLSEGGTIGGAYDATGRLTNLALFPNQVNGLNAVGGTTSPVQFDTNGNLVPLVIGNRVGTPFSATVANILATGGLAQSGPIDTSGGNGFSLLNYGQITSDLERISASGFLSYDFADDVRFFGEGTYYRANSRELVNQPVFNGLAFGGASAPLTFFNTNPFLTEQARAALAATGTTRFTLSRASADLVTPRPRAENELYRFVAGFEGDFGFLGRTFNYEISGNYGKSQATFFDTALNQQRFVNAVNVTTNAAGQIVCNPNVTAATNAAPGGVLPVADAACAPLNVFGAGRASPAALAYITQNTVARTSLEQIVFNSNIGGTLFNLFGNGVGANVGYEHREESQSFTPDAFLQQGLGRSVAIAPVQGSFNVDEIFGEVLVPVVTPSNGLSFLNVVELNAKGRLVSNTVNGKFTAYTFGGRLGFTRDLTFRGNFTRSFRAPAIAELFSPRTNIFSFVTDYCTPANRTLGPDPATRDRNCAAFLARYPSGTPLSAASASVPGISGGNPRLQNEVADSYTFGGLLTPRFLPRFTFSADYINIKIKQPIVSLTAAEIGSACFDNPVFDTADPANGNQFCSLIRRDANGQVINDALNPGVITSFINGVSTQVDGIQVSGAYSIPLNLGVQGNFSVSGSGLWVNKRLPNITGVAPQRTNTLNTDPEFSYQVNANYDTDAGGLFTSVNWRSATFASLTATVENSQFIKYPEEYFVNLGFYIKFADRSRFNIAVTNVFDNIGTFPIQYNSGIGRSFAMTFQHRF